MGNDTGTAALSRKRLLGKVASRFISGLAVIGLLLFLPAGSLSWWNGWLFLAALGVPMLFALVWLLVKAPDLLEKRMRLKEREKPQQLYLVASWIFALVAFSIPGLDHRFGWSHVPLWLVILATVAMLAGYGLFIAVMAQNRYASRVVEIQEGQQLIDTGLYAVVRHPMYLAALIIYLVAPLVLGSYWGLVPMALLPPILALRIRNEEEVLAAGLPGYREYRRRVRYRVIPGVW